MPCDTRTKRGDSVYWLRLLWVGALATWTAGLLWPIPHVAALDSNDLPVTPRALIGKTLHLAVYAALTFFGMRLVRSWPARFALLFVLMAHAGWTESLQSALELGRTGSPNDVCLDHLGVLIGLLATAASGGLNPAPRQAQLTGDDG